MIDAGWQGLVWRQRTGRNLSPDAKLFGAYLLSGPTANRIGCFALRLDDAARETGLLPERIDAVLIELEQAGFARLDRACGWIWLPEVLEQHPFGAIEEVRGALPDLASVPRDAAFHAEVTRVFRASADRPGAAPPSTETVWLAGLLGDSRAAELAQRLAAANLRLRRRLPGLPSLDAARLQEISKLMITILDFLKRYRLFLISIINTKALRSLGIVAVIAAILFVVFPGIDLGVAGLFFAPPRSFTLGETWVGRFFDGEIHYAMEWFIVLFVGAFAYGVFRRRPVFGLTAKRFLFVALSIALGAGLLTNVVLKDHWGRARPSQIVEFGGTKQFTPPFMRSTQCDKNCSFVSGDASLAASFMAFAVIADRNRRRWWAGLGLFTATVGVMRMARGSHFLSDVVFAVIFSLMIVLVLERLILRDGWRGWPGLRARKAVD